MAKSRDPNNRLNIPMANRRIARKRYNQLNQNQQNSINMVQQLPLLDRNDHSKHKSPQFRVKGEHQCVHGCADTSEPLGKFATVEAPTPRVIRVSPRVAKQQRENQAIQGASAFLPKLTDLNQQSENLLPKLNINQKRMNSPKLLPKLTTIKTRIGHQTARQNIELEANTDEGNYDERECLSQAIRESQLHLLTKSRDSQGSSNNSPAPAHAHTIKVVRTTKHKHNPSALSPVNMENQ